MREKPRISQILIIVLIAALGGYVIFGGGIRIYTGWQSEFQVGLKTKVERMFLPGLTVQAEPQNTNLNKWVVDQAMQMIPLGNYVNQKQQEQAEVEDQETFQMILAQQESDENEVDEDGNLINADKEAAKAAETSAKAIDISLDKLKNFDYLVSNFYTVDSSTMIKSDELNAEKFLKKDMHIKKDTKGPKVLIFHTHSQEAFKDSRKGKKSDTIVGMGEQLTKLLNDSGIETIHHEGVYDLIDGKLDRSKAYEKARPAIEKILKENPTIEVVIDLHRDGVGEKTHLVTEIDGKQTAQIMFFNGLCRTRANGDIKQFSNPYIQDNLAFSFQMKLTAEENYPGFTRHNYLKAYRYNMQLAKKMLLIECGAQTNSVEEIKNAMTPLAETLHRVLTE